MHLTFSHFLSNLISQFRYKSRVYQEPNVNEKQIEKLHTQVSIISISTDICRFTYYAYLFKTCLFFDTQLVVNLFSVMIIDYFTYISNKTICLIASERGCLGTRQVKRETKH